MIHQQLSAFTLKSLLLLVSANWLQYQGAASSIPFLIPILDVWRIINTTLAGDRLHFVGPEYGICYWLYDLIYPGPAIWLS